MPYTLYEIVVPSFIKQLKVLSTLLKKGLAHTKNEEGNLLAARLIADMQPLPFQIQRVSDTAKGVLVRLSALPAGVESTFPDTESSFAELEERIQKTINLLEKVDPKDFEGKEEAEVQFANKTLTGKEYVIDYAVPNFYFHFVTTYALLRKEGVPIGKSDFRDRGE